MATFTTFDSFVEALAEKKHNLSTAGDGGDTLTVALTTAAPTSGLDVLADLTEIAYTNCSSRVITTVSSQRPGDGATYTLTLQDLVLTASGGAIATFRYVVIYNDTAANDELIGWSDYGENVDLADTETITLDFATEANGGVLTLGACP